MKKHLLIILSVILLVSLATGCSVNTVNNETNITVINSVLKESEAISEETEKAKEVSKTEKKTEKEKTKATSTSTTKKEEKTSGTKKAAKAKTTKKTTAQKVKKAEAKKAEAKKASQKAQEQNICYITVECSAINSKKDKLKEGHESFVPENGLIIPRMKCEFKDGETVYDILERACKTNNVKLSSRNTVYGIYVSGINNLDEFDCGSASGWVYTVNSKSPPKSCGKYTVSSGDEIIFKYVC